MSDHIGVSGVNTSATASTEDTGEFSDTVLCYIIMLASLISNVSLTT